ncbi:Oxygen-independent coproporphyrinogen-III oxidase [Anaerobiospirillum thomasii]|uniref:radical SAM family heme chaperone HemW n=1 Tax=Anaerobiospirillum thomasii TaxID=179995 RepID=UPI000DA09CCB|nr:radical SAM family heme chaperone HemW [Anaerobiospirillum thomasii]SPT71385.1 Oxygen-independent coproporphyrinogen-III oxidase [Anaerobiospirillum thomasii]
MHTKLSLYLHYPWCIRKCPYCDFNSHKKDISYDEAYFARLLDDFKASQEYIQGRQFISVFVGGGTPSLGNASCYASFFDTIAQFLDKDCEITFEANPGTVDYKNLCDFKAAGFNRISIGVQSFDNAMLKALGRIHDSDEAKKACLEARRAGFLRRNFDLMHTLPGQSTAMALADLQTACDLECTHLSWYELTIEEDTHFGAHPPVLPDEDTMLDIEEQGFEFLQKHGFERYEVSAFTKERRCVHNENYWLFGDYLGLGAGAHSKISLGQSIMRRAHHSLPKSYMQEDYARFYNVSDNDVPFEYMLNRLRLFDSISLTDFTDKTGLDVALIEDKLHKASELGLICFDTANTYHITRLGKIMLNDILALFLE